MVCICFIAVLLGSLRTHAGLPFGDAVIVADLLVDHCTYPLAQNVAYTAVLEDKVKPNPSLFEKEVYDGINRSSTDPNSIRLIEARREALNFLNTGRRFRLMREFESECVYVAHFHDLLGSDPLPTLGNYSQYWQTNYETVQLYDATAKLGFNRALASPHLASVVTDQNGTPIQRMMFHQLYSIEPEFAFSILMGLKQTNVVSGGAAICDPTWQDFSRVLKTKNVEGIRIAIETRKVQVALADSGTYDVSIQLDGPKSILKIQFAPNAKIKIPRVEVIDNGAIVRTVTRNEVASRAWFAEWSDHSNAEQARSVYYFHVEPTSVEKELADFSAQFVQKAKMSTSKDAHGGYETILDGNKVTPSAHDSKSVTQSRSFFTTALFASALSLVAVLWLTRTRKTGHDK